MHIFRVWATLPKKVEVQVNAETFPMTVDAGGWWSAEISSAKACDDYGFILDGEGPFPDPRSSSQPSGVHKLSRLIDQNSFSWTDEKFKPRPLSTAVIYELHLGTFTSMGTFVSAIEKLGHLTELGVTHVELMPVVEFSGNHGWGYDGVDLFAPHHALGRPDDLKKLVNACHACGIAVILDVVYNHLGPAGNYLAMFAPYFTKKFASTWGEGLNFDGGDSGEVRRFFCDNALMWLRGFHFDGLRLDAIHGIVDTSATHFLEQLKAEVEQLSMKLGRDLVLIPESDLNDPRLLWPRKRGGFQLDAQWNDDFHHALHTVLTGEREGYYSDFGTMALLAKTLRHAFAYDGNYSKHRRRNHGRSSEGLSGHQFLGYLQNHDQIGNRARGERISQLISIGKLKIGAALVFTSPFVPMLFQGEEWGASTPFFYFTDYQEPELAKAVREGRCREFAAFGWKPEDTADPQAVETFEKSKLKWAELKQEKHAGIFNWYQQLIRLRNNEPALNDGQMDCVDISLDEVAHSFTLRRGNISVMCNLSTHEQSISLRRGVYRLLLTSEAGSVLADGQITLAPESVTIIKETSG